MFHEYLYTISITRLLTLNDYAYVRALKYGCIPGIKISILISIIIIIQISFDHVPPVSFLYYDFLHTIMLLFCYTEPSFHRLTYCAISLCFLFLAIVI